MTEALTFIDPDGVETPFSSATIETLWGVSGRFMPRIAFIEDEVPEQAGARIRNVKVLPKEVAVPLHLENASAAELRVALRDLARRLYPVRGDGRLRCVAPDGETRELLCRYSSGYELVETRDDGGVTWQRAAIVFRAAEDPFWRAVDPVELGFSTGEPPSFFPIFPIRLARSSVLGGVTIDNPGDVEAWPIWTITGPGSNPTVRNVTTGEEISLTTVLAPGQQIIIDTTPGVKTILREDGTNLFPDLLDGYSLFPLDPGPVEISVEMDATTGASEVAVTYRPRYLTP